jgi:RHS repeat-associated protein
LWDIENRLTSVSENGTTTATFVYDGDGNRVKKIENGQTILYINQYYEVNLTSGNVTSSYYLGGKLIATSENGTLRYVHQDSLSSTSLMTDASGNQIDTTVKYLPFGEARATVTIPTDKLFTGQRLDATGLYYYNARYYDPTIGRFISPDTVIQSPANPQCFNRYSYCLNNPLKYTDPSGSVVTFGNEQIEASWKCFAAVCPSLAKLVEESSTTYNIKYGDLGFNTLGAYGDHVMTLNSRYYEGNKKGGATEIGHEIVHLIASMYHENTPGSKYDSVWEELLAFRMKAFVYSQTSFVTFNPALYWNQLSCVFYANMWFSYDLSDEWMSLTLSLMHQNYEDLDLLPLLNEIFDQQFATYMSEIFKNYVGGEAPPKDSLSDNDKQYLEWMKYMMGIYD